VLAEDTEKKFSQELARLEDLIHDSSHVLTEKGMEDYIAKINKVKQSLERYVNVKAQLLETRINEISEMVKGMEASRDFLQMDEKITGLETRMAAEIGDVKRNIEGIDGMKREMEHVKGYIDQQKAGQDATMAETRAKMEENMKKVSLDFTYRINQMKKTIEQETEKFKSLIGEQEIESMKSEIEEIRKAADNENAHRLSLEKNFDDLENAIKNFNVREEVESVKRSIENETANRLSLEKSLADMEKNLTEMKEKYSGITGLEHMDFEKVEQEIAAFRDSVKSAEREMNLKAMNIITEQLNEFARTMDRRMPDLMTKDEFFAALGEIKTKMQGIQAPDLRPLALRVEQLEREISNISNMMHAMYNRLPIVVE